MTGRASDLNERQRFALGWLNKETEPGQRLYGGAGARAHMLGSAMVEAGLLTNRNKRSGASQGAANALVALRRRGLADNSTPGGEAFQSVEWGITEAGRELDAELRRNESI